MHLIIHFRCVPRNIWKFKLQIIHVQKHLLCWVVRLYIFLPRSWIYLAEIKPCLRPLQGTSVKLSFRSVLSFGAVTKWNYLRQEMTSSKPCKHVLRSSLQGKSCTRSHYLFSINFAFFHLKHVLEKVGKHSKQSGIFDHQLQFIHSFMSVDICNFWISEYSFDW